MAGNANSGPRAKKPPAGEPALMALLEFRYWAAPASEITESDCKEASREVSKLLAMGKIDHRVAETFDKGIRTTLQGIRQEHTSAELRQLQDMEKRAEERERGAAEREAKQRQRRE